MRSRRLPILTLTTAALLLAIGVAVNFISTVTFPIGGMPILRLSLSGPFIKMVALLFGPVLGGMAGGLSDILNFFLHPSGGAYNPFITLVAVLKGVAIGLSWQWVNTHPSKALRIIINTVFICLIVFCAFFMAMIIFLPGSSFSDLLVKFSDKGTAVAPVSIPPLAFGSVLILLSALQLIFANAHRAGKSFLARVFQIMVAIGPASLLFDTVNTYILFLMYNPSRKAFFLMWLPRIIIEMLTVLYNAYLLAFLFMVYNRIVPKHQ